MLTLQGQSSHDNGSTSSAERVEVASGALGRLGARSARGSRRLRGLVAAVGLGRLSLALGVGARAVGGSHGSGLGAGRAPAGLGGGRLGGRRLVAGGSAGLSGSRGRGSRGGAAAGGSRGVLVALAREIKDGLRVQVAANDTETGIGGLGLGILHGVPPDIGLAEHGAANLLPVVLGILLAGDSGARLLTRDGPAGLSDPDGLAGASVLDLLKSSEVEVAAVGNLVVLVVLEVGVGVHAEPVKSVNDGLVGAVDVGGPGVDVAEGSILQAGALDGIADLLDVVDNGLGVGAREAVGVLLAEVGVTVKILATNGDTGNETVELAAVLVNCLLEGGDFVLEAVAGGPETEEKASLCVDGSLDGGDGLVGSAGLLFGGHQLAGIQIINTGSIGSTYNHGVETGTAEDAIGSLQVSGSLELGLEVGLLLGGTTSEGAAIVEAGEGGSCGADGDGQRQQARGRRHFV